MNTAVNQKVDCAPRPGTSWLHPWVPAVLAGLVAWFVLGIWSFAAAGPTDYLLFIVSSFFFAVVALTFILSLVGHGDPAKGTDEANADNKPQQSFRDWVTSDFDTYQDRLSGAQAATFGMTAFGIVFLVVEHGGL
ncbi:MAG TPA: hypothetical protein VKS24_10140 [Bradyrhizobium sp.]|nr:hypothetical protein [Bradyrhizobium sp.]